MEYYLINFNLKGFYFLVFFEIAYVAEVLPIFDLQKGEICEITLYLPVDVDVDFSLQKMQKQYKDIDKIAISTTIITTKITICAVVSRNMFTYVVSLEFAKINRPYNSSAFETKSLKSISYLSVYAFS